MVEVIEYIPVSLILGLVCCLVIIVLYRLITDRWYWQKFMPYFLFITYIAAIIQIAYLSRVPGSRTDVTFGLGDTWGNTLQAHAYVIENVLMFIPFGILFPMLGRVPLYICLPVAVYTSITLEGMQYVTQRGYCQLDDVIANTIGACIGYVIILLLYGLRRIIKHHKKREL